MDGYAPHRRIGLGRQGDGIPGVAAVPGAQEHAGGSGRAVAVTHKYVLRMPGLHGHVAAERVGERVLGIGNLPSIAVIGAGVQVGVGHDQHRMGLSHADLDVMSIGVFNVYPGPGIAAVHAAPDPVHFYRHPDVVRIGRVDGHRSGPGYAHIDAFFSNLDGAFVPMFPSVHRAEKESLGGAREHHFGFVLVMMPVA